MEELKTATATDLYGDVLLSVFAFGRPLEIWSQRLTNSYWRKIVPVALSRVIKEVETSDTEIRRVADLCPNVKILDLTFSTRRVVQ